MTSKKKEIKQAEVDDPDDAAMETELFLAVLKSRLGRYQEAGDKLAVDNFKLTDELAKQKVTLQDINEFLTNELKARSVTTTQLEERVLELTNRMQEVQKESQGPIIPLDYGRCMRIIGQAEVARIRAEAAADVEFASAKVSSLVTQLAGSQEFVEKKDALERQINDLKLVLAAKQRETEQVLRCVDT
eukprot:gene8322-8507_t